MRILLLMTMVTLLVRSPACVAMDERDAAALAWSAHSILAARSVATISAEAGYRVTAIHRQAGEAFRTGDVLIELDDRHVKIKREGAKAALNSADAELDAVGRLHERDSASLTELEEAKRNRAQAWARLSEIELELESCAIRAPFDGRVAEVLVNVHELVSRGTQIIRIEDDSRLLAHFILPEAQWGKRAIGDAIDIGIPLVGVRATATVSRIASGIDPASRTFDMWADVDNAAGALRPGMTANMFTEPVLFP